LLVILLVTTLALGLQPKQKHGKVWVESATQESHFHSQECEGINPYIHKWILTFGIRIPMESWIFKEIFQGSKFVRLKISLYQLKVLEMSKMNLHDSSEYLKDKLWPKKGRESLCQFYSHPLKVANCPEICMCRWCATYY